MRTILDASTIASTTSSNGRLTARVMTSQAEFPDNPRGEEPTALPCCDAKAADAAASSSSTRDCVRDRVHASIHA
jgi:hypothetical protein